MNHYYTIGNGIINITSNIKLNQKQLYPITPGNASSTPDITIQIENSVPFESISLHNIDRFCTDINSNFLFFNDIYYRKLYQIVITNLHTSATIQATPATLKRKHQTLRGNLYDIINDIILIKLIQKGYTYIHAATVSKNNNGIIYPGFCGTGKTLKAHDMMQNGYKYLSDDLSLIDTNGNSYLNYAPSTISYNDYIKHVPCSLKTKLHSKLVENNLFLMKYIPLPTIDIVGNNTVPQTKVNDIQFLTPINNSTLTNILQINEYSIEFPWNNRIWHMYSYFNNTFNIDDIHNKYKLILKSFITKVYQ